MNFQSCPICDFSLYHPIANLNVSYWGLYDDTRFKGRSILALKDHYDDLTEVPDSIMNNFFQDIKNTIQKIKNVTGTEKVNLAILGNTVPHVHAHLIPRFPQKEEQPHKSPWNDPRPLTLLTLDERSLLIKKLRTQ